MTVVIAGCGDLGTEAGLRFAAAGHRVIGLRRRPALLPKPIEGHRCDLTSEIPDLPTDSKIVVLALAPDASTEDGYRKAYLDAPSHVLDALEHAGAQPDRILLVSSTSVWGGIDDGGLLDEASPVAPRPGTGEIVYAGEQMVRQRFPRAVILRLSGLYGPGRDRLLRRIRAGTAYPGPDRYTNRIHRDDAAAAIVHLTDGVEDLAHVYIGSDCAPAPRSEVTAFLAQEMGVPDAAGAQACSDGSTQRNSTVVSAGKRLRNALLLESGFGFTYPTFREGYRAVLAARGVRHP